MMFRLFRKNVRSILCDIHGEYRFSIKGYEIIATFTEKPNREILPRLKEILLGDLHIRQNGIFDIKLKENIKEAV